MGTMCLVIDMAFTLSVVTIVDVFYVAFRD